MKKSVLLQCRQRARFAAARLVRTLTPEVGKKEQLRAQIRQREIGTNINI